MRDPAGHSARTETDPQENECLCGCGQQTLSPGAKYLPSHHLRKSAKHNERMASPKMKEPMKARFRCGARFSGTAREVIEFSKKHRADCERCHAAAA